MESENKNYAIKIIKYDFGHFYFILSAIKHLQMRNFNKDPNILKNNQGREYIELGNNYAYLTEWIPSRVSNYNNPVELAAVSKKLGELHECSSGFTLNREMNPRIGWYSWIKVFETRCNEILDFKNRISQKAYKSKFDYIGALKTNRVIFPKGHKRLGIKIHKFAMSLNIDDFNLVTVKNKEYYIYNYIGDLNDRKNVSIVFSYPKDSFQKDKALKAFISLDSSLQPIEILNHYIDRWAIEPFFRECKSYLGLNGYQVRSEKSISRYLIIMIISNIYCKLYCNTTCHFHTGYKEAKKDLQKNKVIYIYEAAASGTPLSEIFQILKIA